MKICNFFFLQYETTMTFLKAIVNILSKTALHGLKKIFVYQRLYTFLLINKSKYIATEVG